MLRSPLRRVRAATLPLLLTALAVGCEETSKVDVPASPEISGGAAPGVRRLTEAQYARSIQDVLGTGIAVPPDIEPDLRVGGLVAIGSSEGTISRRGVERFEEASYAIAAQALAEEHRASLLTCEPAAVRDAECAASFLADKGHRLWRRPLTDAELAELVELSGAAAETLGDFHAGLEFGLAAMLQSPNFLFRPEKGEPSPSGEGLRLSAHELATRLSYLLWNTTPDDELLAAADAGDLQNDDVLSAQVRRMLDDERARDGIRAWASDMLHLSDLEDVRKDAATFPNLSDSLLDSAREETLRLVEHLVLDTSSDFRDLVTTRETFVDRELAALYGVPTPDVTDWSLVELPESRPRRGLLGHASILSMAAHPLSTSPTLRGAFIREVMLCQPMPAPPADVDTSIPEITEAAPTLRDRIAVHLENPACASCHQLTDPIGLALENFDGIGRFRESENGVLIDAHGELDGVTYNDAIGLSAALREHPDFSACMVETLFRYGVGRNEVLAELDSVSWLRDVFAAYDYQLEPTLYELATSPLFRHIGEVQ